MEEDKIVLTSEENDYLKIIINILEKNILSYIQIIQEKFSKMLFEIIYIPDPYYIKDFLQDEINDFLYCSFQH